MTPARAFLPKRTLLVEVYDAACGSPYDFAGSVLFAVGSLFYVTTALMALTDTYDAYHAAWLDVAAPGMDCLSSVAYFRGWQLSWRRRSTGKLYRPFEYLTDFAYYGCLFFSFGSLSYLIEAILYACDTDPPFDVDILSSALLVVSSTMAFIGSARQWQAQRDEVVLTPKSADRHYVYILSPFAPSSGPFGEQKVFWLFWADFLYLMGSILYALYSYVPYFGMGAEASEHTQNYFNMIGSLLFVADCYLYVLSFVQLEGQSTPTHDSDQEIWSINDTEADDIQGLLAKSERPNALIVDWVA